MGSELIYHHDRRLPRQILDAVANFRNFPAVKEFLKSEIIFANKEAHVFQTQCSITIMTIMMQNTLKVTDLATQSRLESCIGRHCS